MKKTLLTIFSGVLLAGTASAQCTPDPQYDNANGYFFPDSATFYDNNPAFAGVAYSAQLDVKTITDTAFSAGPISALVYIDAFKIDRVEGAPAGFEFTGGGPTYEQPDPNPAIGDGSTDSIWWNTYGSGTDPLSLDDVRGCVTISATPAAVSAAAPATGFTDYPVVVYVDARIAGTDPDLSFIGIGAGDWLTDPGVAAVAGGALPIDGYVLRVEAASSVADLLNPNVFEVHQSYPNPADDEATITFTTPRMENIDVKVFNMLGAVVYDQTILSENGVNDIKINTGRMSSGLYIYTVSNGTKTFTKKMTVK